MQKASVSEIIWPLSCQGVPALTGCRHPVKVLGGPQHLSYPFVVEHLGEVYCVPESYQSGLITFYRRDAVTGSFVNHSVLLDHVAAVDPTLFFYNGLWWLFYTVRKYAATHLYISYANELTGKYIPHPCNPVKIDVRSARPAGTPFFHDGALYRPSQDCSVTYGGRVIINRVVKLTIHEFHEQAITMVEPADGTPYTRGLHTISGVGDFTLIDGKRFRFNPGFFMSQIKEKLAKRRAGNV